MVTSFKADLADLAGDLAEIVNRIVWSTVTTSDRLGRPRSRIMHPVWQITPDRVIGVIGTFPTPVKQAHLARSPWLTCGYWSPDHDAAFIDCHATWATDTHQAWTHLTAGYDPTTIWPNGPTSPNFAALLLTPHRIQIIKAADMAAGTPTPMWTAARTTDTASSIVTKS